MANDDFYTNAASHRIRVLDAEKAAHLADLAAFRANGDTESAAGVVQALANAEAERANLIALHNQYVASQRPPQEPELTDSELHAKPWNRMSPTEGLRLAHTSKYGKGLDWSDKNVQAGYREVMARRSRGE
jgi:hypothetical protein